MVAVREPTSKRVFFDYRWYEALVKHSKPFLKVKGCQCSDDWFGYS